MNDMCILTHSDLFSQAVYKESIKFYHL